MNISKNKLQIFPPSILISIDSNFIPEVSQAKLWSHTWFPSLSHPSLVISLSISPSLSIYWGTCSWIHLSCSKTSSAHGIGFPADNPRCSFKKWPTSTIHVYEDASEMFHLTETVSETLSGNCLLEPGQLSELWEIIVMRDCYCFMPLPLGWFITPLTSSYFQG